MIDLRVKFLFCLICYVVVSLKSYGQQLTKLDSTFLLEAVVVEARRLKEYDAGAQVISIDSSTIKTFEAMSLSEMLTQTMPVFVKTYNPGSLATTSFRGMGAGHTAVLWNGFPIQSPMNGQIEFSLLPGSIVDAVNLQLGGEGALWGSGTVGGTVYLENLPKYNSGLQARINQTLGSFGKYFQGYKLTYGKNKLYTSLNVYRDKADNNFTFNNKAKARSPEEEMQHAAFKEWGVLLENYLKISDYQQLAIRYWHQDTEREIPATLTEGSSSATQDDQFNRFLLSWSGNLNSFDWKLQSGFSLEELLYKNDASGIESLSKSKVFIQEAELNWYPLDHLSFQGGVQHQYVSGTVEDYEDGKQEQQRLALLGGVKFNTQFFESRINLRKEFTEFGNVPLVPTFGVELNPWNFLIVSGKIARSYRLPTFNDLYWKPGGNPDLLPESGWSKEAGIRSNFKLFDIKNQFQFTVFSNKIDNWILWQPGSTYWYPQNIKQVWARGIETSYTVEKRWDKTSFNIIARYHYTKSTNEKHQTEDDPSLGKQLIYTPLHKGNLNFTYNYNDFGITWSQQFTGKTFTTTDNDDSLPAFTTSNLSFQYKLDKKYGYLNLRVSANNLFDEDYEIIAWRPMPGRNYQFSLIISPKLNF